MDAYESDLKTALHLNSKLNTQGWYQGPSTENVGIYAARKHINENSDIFISYRSKKKTSTFTMKRALITVLVTFMVAGLFFDHCDAILRAGRDRIEKFHRAMEERRQVPTAVECSGPDCYYKGTDGYKLANTLEIFAILR